MIVQSRARSGGILIAVLAFIFLGGPVPEARESSERPPPSVSTAIVPQSPSSLEAGVKDSGRLIIHQLLFPVGEETYELTSDGATQTLHADFVHRDRGTHTILNAEVILGSDLAIQSFRLREGSPPERETTVAVEDAGLVTIGGSGDARRVAAPTRFFAAVGSAPYSILMLAVRYWLAHGRPDSLPIFPKGQLKIHELGGDVVADRQGASVRLTRFALDGLVWGRQIVWLDAAGSLVAAINHSFPYEIVREGFEGSLEDFARRARADELARWERISRSLPSVDSPQVALVGGRVIAGTETPPLEQATILIRGGRITAIGAGGEVEVPADARVVNVAGKSILPGLWDMHAHLGGVPDWGLAYLGVGVTTARDLGDEVDWVLALREGFSSGRLAGPRLLIAAEIDGEVPEPVGAIQAGTADEAVRLVARFHELGFDQIKIYQSLPPKLVAVIADEAHRRGMTVTGHVPTGMDALQAVAAGMDQINHLLSLNSAFLPGIPSWPHPGWTNGIANLDLGSSRARAVMDALVRADVVVDPTIAAFEWMFRSEDAPLAEIHPHWKQFPNWLTDLIPPGLPTEAASAKQPIVAKYIETIRRLHQAGVRIVAGTDCDPPGHALHRELELYVQAGMTPMEAIRSATAVPARAMGQEHEVGTLEVGKRADIIVVDGDPLRSIREIRKVSAVMVAGRLYDVAELWRALAGAR